MKVILDTNVFVSGVFFSGPPYQILNAWRSGDVDLVLSPEILDEYRRVGEELSKDFPDADLDPFLELLALKGHIFESPALEERVCDDPDDDKFLACALASRTRLVVTGDRALLRVSGYRGIRILSPREFVEICLKKRQL